MEGHEERITKNIISDGSSPVSIGRQPESEPEGGGIQFYRCVLCRGVVSPWDIKELSGCPRCKNVRVVMSDLNLWEKIVQVFKHPKVWEWGE